MSQINSLQEAAQHDLEASVYFTWARDTRWPWARWWYRRRARHLMESADIWRGLEWRRRRTMKAYETKG